MNRHVSMVIAAVLVSAAGAPAAHATFLDSVSEMQGVSIPGDPPTRIILAEPQYLNTPRLPWVAFEQTGVTGVWKQTGILPATYRSPSMVLVRPTTNTWTTHVFYSVATGSSGAVGVGHAMRTQAGTWTMGTVPAMPAGLNLIRGPVAVSNVLSTGTGQEPQSTTPQMAVYFLGSNSHLYGASWSGSTWSSGWNDLGVPSSSAALCNASQAGCEPEASAWFNDGAFSTSVWIATFPPGEPEGYNNDLAENSGPFDSIQRTWTLHAPAQSLMVDIKPVAVTWYDTRAPRNPSYAHTRVMFASDDPHNPANNWRVYAYFREPNGTDGFEYLDLQSGLPLNAGLVVQDCGQCTSPSIKVRVLAMNLNDSTDRIWVLDKDNSNTARSLVDQWSPLPRPSQEDFSIMRLPFGYGGDLGQIYSSDVRGHLREYAPASGVWLDRMFPGGPVLSAVSGADGNLQVFTTTKWEQYFALMNWQDSNSGNWGNFDTVQFSPAGNTLAYSTVVGAIGALGVLNFVGIDKATNKAALIATQTPDHYWHGAGTLLPGQTVTLKALAAEVNTGGLLQVVGISNSDKRAYHVGRQSPVGWQSPGTLLPGQTANLTAITAARGNSNFLQVLGLGEDGMAYLVAWQDGSSNWHPGFIMPGQTPPLAAISVVRGNGGTLQLIGLTTTGVAYLVAWQDSGGTWNSGFVLPAPSVLMSTITTQVGAGGAHVIGLGAFDGLPYLVSSQDGNGNWNAGFQLPSAGVPLSGLTVGRGANSTLQVLGLGSDELIYQASVEEMDSSWHAGAGLLP